MKRVLESYCSRALTFARSETASTLMTFALATPVLLGAVGIAVDYGRAALLRTRMQSPRANSSLLRLHRTKSRLLPGITLQAS
jgi:Flp pilus assembly protein TadG